MRAVSELLVNRWAPINELLRVRPRTDPRALRPWKPELEQVREWAVVNPKGRVTVMVSPAMGHTASFTTENVHDVRAHMRGLHGVAVHGVHVHICICMHTRHIRVRVQRSRLCIGSSPQVCHLESRADTIAPM